MEEKTHVIQAADGPQSWQVTFNWERVDVPRPPHRQRQRFTGRGGITPTNLSLIQRGFRGPCFGLVYDHWRASVFIGARMRHMRAMLRLR